MIGDLKSKTGQFFRKVSDLFTGFQLRKEGKISLKKYYEGVNSLSQLRGYKIKYESICRTELYQKFKNQSLEK